MSLKIKLLTWNTQGAVVGGKLTALVDYIKQNQVDLTVLQEASEIADGEVQDLGKPYKAMAKTRVPAEQGERGYVLIYNKDRFKVESAMFDEPIMSVDSSCGPPVYQRPPLKFTIAAKDGSPTKIILDTWHAPMGAKSHNLGFWAVRSWRLQAKEDITSAKEEDLLWILAGDLNITSKDVRDLFESKFGYKTAGHANDHVVVCYGMPAEVTVSAQALDAAGSDHQPVLATIKI